MDDIHVHLAAHSEWHRVLAIANETVVSRQDDERVGLLHQQGIRVVPEVESFVDSNLGLNVVSTVAATLDSEFQKRVEMAMCRFGQYRSGRPKQVQRSQSPEQAAK